MNYRRGIIVHASVLVISAAVALAVWRNDDSGPELNEEATVTVWNAKASTLRQVEYRGSKRTIVMTARTDKFGQYFLGAVDTKSTPPPNKNQADAGAPSSKSTHKVFVAGDSAAGFAKQISNLKAFRSVGKLDDGRVSEFGFDKSDGKIIVQLGTTKHELTLGGTTPGGLDRYVRDERGNVFAIPGGVVRDITMADSRLMQRELHAWSSRRATTVFVKAGSKQVEFVRIDTDAGAMGWASASSPRRRNETVENWLTKIDHLRGMSYIDAPELAKQAAVVFELSYRDNSGASIGYTKMLKRGNGDSAEYFIESEQTRLPMKILTTSASQVEQDMSSVLR